MKTIQELKYSTPLGIERPNLELGKNLSWGRLLNEDIIITFNWLVKVAGKCTKQSIVCNNALIFCLFVKHVPIAHI